LERLRQEVDNQQAHRSAPNKSQVRAPALRASAAPVARQPQRNQRDAPARSGAAFHPQDFLDHQVLELYHSRASPDDKLPSVPFTKKAESLYFLGCRKCAVEDLQGLLYVKKGQDYIPLQEWFEKTERVEGLRLKGAKSAATFFVFQQQGVF